MSEPIKQPETGPLHQSAPTQLVVKAVSIKGATPHPTHQRALAMSNISKENASNLANDELVETVTEQLEALAELNRSDVQPFDFHDFEETEKEANGRWPNKEYYRFMHQRLHDLQNQRVAEVPGVGTDFGNKLSEKGIKTVSNIFNNCIFTFDLVKLIIIEDLKCIPISLLHSVQCVSKYIIYRLLSCYNNL